MPVIGFTGTGGSGKSSLVDEFLRRFLLDFPERRVAVISVDPSKRRTGGALLGDRIRMNAIPHERAFMRSMATRQANLSLSPAVGAALDAVRVAGYDLVVLETSGIGQSDTEIVDVANLAVYVMTPEYGAASQLEKIDMLDFADLIAINKADKQGADDALREVRKQFRRNRVRFDGPDEDLPVYPTIASDFNDPGTNQFYLADHCRPGGQDQCRVGEFTCRSPPTWWTNKRWYLRHESDIWPRSQRRSVSYDQWAAEQSDCGRGRVPAGGGR